MKTHPVGETSFGAGKVRRFEMNMTVTGLFMNIKSEIKNDIYHHIYPHFSFSVGIVDFASFFWGCFYIGPSSAEFGPRLCTEKEHAATEERLPLPEEPSKDRA